MGNCSSCESTDVVTAKVVLQDGRLQEFACPIRVSQVLEKNPDCFICNSDDMDYDSFVSAINGDEQLHAGQLYFALPISLLKNPVRAEEMASLAVKASLALKASNCGHQRWCGSSCGMKRVDAVVYTTSNNNVLRSSQHELVVGSNENSGGSTAVGSRGQGFVEKKRKHHLGGGEGGGSLTTIMEE